MAVSMQLLEHPLTVDAMLVRVVKNVDFPEREEELSYDRIAHDANHNTGFVVDIRLRERKGFQGGCWARRSSLNL